MVYLYGLKNNVIRCYFEIHMLSVVNYHGPGLIETLVSNATYDVDDCLNKCDQVETCGKIPIH